MQRVSGHGDARMENGDRYKGKEGSSKMKKKLLLWSLICMLMMVFLPGTAQAAWKNTAEGKMYTTSSSPGYYIGLKSIKGSKYYFSGKGIMQTGWVKIKGKYYYFGSDGKMRTGFQTIKGKVYYLTSSGPRKSGWLTVKSGGKTLKYYFSKKGVMQTGLQTINKKMYYFNESGVRQYGWIKINDKNYYANKSTGVLVQEQWVGKYYFQEDGTMAVNQWINGKWVGADGRYTGVKNNVGWIADGGIKCYYDKNSQKVTGWLTLSGKKYYLSPSNGALQYGWFTVGIGTYYADKNGVVQVNTWNGKKYLRSSGAMAKGWLTIGDKRYFFNTSTGEMVTGWKQISKKYYYFGTDGVKQSNTWVDDKYYVGADGTRCYGVTKIGNYYYYFSQKSGGVLLKKWIKYGSDTYYAHKVKGYLYRNKWFTKGSYKYYAGSDCKIYKGLQTVGGKVYYFNTSNGRMTKSSKLTVGTDTYYFSSSGAAVTSKWVKISGKYYYFESNGKMAVSKWVGQYYVGADGARTDKQLTVGLSTAGGKTYCYDSNGTMITGWYTVDGNKYYFGSDGAALTGIHVIANKKYYFYSTGIMASGLTLAIGDKQYTINSSGVVTAEDVINISGNTVGSKIAKFAIKYVGNKYVYGGVSLTNGADCSGFVQTVFANFSIKVLRVADDQMKGPSSYYTSLGYKKAVTVTATTSEMLPGDLVFYGSSNYASHVGIYIGNGQIVHASNSQPYPAGGIKISAYNYTTPIKIVRYWS